MAEWKEAKTADGKAYYYNSQSKETTWTPPPGFQAAPPVGGPVKLADLPTPKKLPSLVNINDASALDAKITSMLDAEDQLMRSLESTLKGLRKKAKHPFAKKAKKIFKEVDLNNQKELDAKDFCRLMEMMGSPISLESAQQHITKADLNGNGKMDFFEFLEFLGY